MGWIVQTDADLLQAHRERSFGYRLPAHRVVWVDRRYRHLAELMGRNLGSSADSR